MRRILFSFLVFAPVLSGAQFGFPQPVEITGQDRYVNHILADLDNDGLQDIAVAAQDVGWYRALGGGQFAPFMVLCSNRPQGGQTLTIAAGDIDGDGSLDLVFELYFNGDHRLCWLRNTGNGQFQGPLEVATAVSVVGIEIADINGDGLGDILTVDDWLTEGLQRYINQGNSWAPSTILSTYHFRFIRLVDTNGNGTLDLLGHVYGEPLPRVGRWNNTGMGNFSAPQFVQLPHIGARDRLFKDIDGNGTTDVVQTFDPFDKVTVVRGNANGTLQPDEVLTTAVDQPYWVDMGDLDGDGLQDLLVEKHSTKELVWCRNTGSGFATPVSLYTSPLTIGKITVSDMDQDGDADVLMYRTGELCWLEVQNNTAVQVHELGRRAMFVENLILDDVDDDGHADVIVSCQQGLDILHNDDGTFGRRTALVTSESYATRRVERSDVDLDGDQDLIAAINGHLLLLRKLSSGVYAEPETLYTANTFIVHTLGDMDQDGFPDLLVLISGEQEVFLLRNSGSGSFGAPELVHSGALATDDEALKVADMDNDGLLDFALGYSENGMSGDYIHFLRNTGGGNFTPLTTVTGGTTMQFRGQYGFWLADMDEDGDTDLVIRRDNPQGIIVRLNNGTGYFSGSSTTPGPYHMLGITDINGDGHLDVLTNFQVLLGNGDATFTADATIGLQANDPVFLGDMDGDGMPDLVGRNVDRPIRWFRNLCASPYRIAGHVYADLDADGTEDPEEPRLPHIPVVLLATQGGTSFTDSSGSFQAAVSIGTYEMTAQAPSPFWTMAAPGSITVQLTEAMPTSTGHALGLQPIGDASLMAPALTFSPAGACGGSGTFWISAVNQGTHTEQGTVQLQLDPTFTYVSSVPEPVSAVDGIYTWDFSELGLFAPLQIAVHVIRPVDPGFSEHMLMVTTMDEDGAVTGSFPHVLNLQNLCSFDPNDKQVLPAGYGAAGAIPVNTTELDYVIRFQNTGTAPAHDIRLEDLLPEALDLQRVVLTGYSHEPDEVSIGTDGRMVVRFNNIMLPDSGADLLASQGYVRFTIGVRDGLPHGTVLFNTAAIHFDLNAPVITNTTRSTLVDCALWQPTVSAVDDLHLETNTGDAYQWYLGDVALFGDTLRTLTFASNGSYSVVVTSSFGCTSTAGPYELIGMGIEEIHSRDLYLAPNPFSQHARLYSRDRLVPEHSIVLVDVYGRTVRSWPGNNDHVLELDRQGLASGAYLLRVTRGERSVGHLHVVLD